MLPGRGAKKVRRNRRATWRRRTGGSEAWNWHVSERVRVHTHGTSDRRKAWRESSSSLKQPRIVILEKISTLLFLYHRNKNEKLDRFKIFNCRHLDRPCKIETELCFDHNSFFSLKVLYYFIFYKNSIFSFFYISIFFLKFLSLLKLHLALHKYLPAVFNEESCAG